MTAAFALRSMRALLCGLALLASAAAAQDRAPRPTLEAIAERLAQDDLAGAATRTAAALAAYPRDPTLLNLAGVVAVRQDDVAQAVAHFERALALDPQAVPAYENLARLHQQRSAEDVEARTRALAIYDRLLTVDPGHVEATYQSAFLLALQGAVARSAARVERLPAPVRQRPQALALHAALLTRLGRVAEAREKVTALETAADLTEADVLAVLPLLDADADAIGLSMLQALDRRGSTTSRSLRALGDALVRAGRPGDARVAYERVVAADGPTVGLLMTLARTALMSDDRDGALGYLAHARAREPGNAQVHFFFGMVCVQSNLVREAYDSLKQAVALAPDDPLINYAMGAVATHRHEPSESLPYFEKYVALRPDDPRGIFALGAALFYAKLFERARDVLTDAARHDATATGAHLFLGRIARQLNDLTTARAELQLALQRDASLADAWAELGLVELRAGAYTEADAAIARALALDPDHYEATLNLATLYARTKDPRRDAQAAKVTRLLEERDARTREFLRIIKVVPPDA